MARAATAAARIEINSVKAAKLALEEMESITEEIMPLMNRSVELKKAVTAFATDKRTTVIQLDDVYYRLIERKNRIWVGTPEDMPVGAPKRAASLREIVKGKRVKVNGKLVPLWNLITKRVVDPELLNQAVQQKWVTEKEIEKAYLEKSQAPFLQRYEGVADG